MDNKHVSGIFSGLRFDLMAVAYWDDIDSRTEDPSTTTFAYTTANELTTMTENGVDTMLAKPNPLCLGGFV